VIEAAKQNIITYCGTLIFLINISVFISLINTVLMRIKIFNYFNWNYCCISLTFRLINKAIFYNKLFIVQYRFL